MDSNAYRRASLFVLLTSIIRVIKRRMRKFGERRHLWYFGLNVRMMIKEVFKDV
jgi:hypothetical protein